MKGISITILAFCLSFPLFGYAQKNLEGIWTEHWYGPTDVNYVDTLKFAVDGDQLFIELVNKRDTFDPVYSDIIYKDGWLSYRHDVNESTNRYKFKLKRSGKWLVGTVETWNGHTRKIILKRLKCRYNKHQHLDL
jgi:hypothetical protein